MSKKKLQLPPKPQEFHSTPFSRLKGVTLPDASPAEIILPFESSPILTVAADDGSDLFLQAMGGVRRIGSKHMDGDKAVRTGRTESRRAKSTPTPPVDPVASDLFMQEIGRLKLDVKFSEQFLDEDVLKPLSGNRIKQLKRGIITVDHQLDLHGLTRDEALAELPRFLRSARQMKQVAALVITGKGNNSPLEPVLQQAVGAWLRDAGRDLVVEFAPAPREMGGSGAFVVFLRPLARPTAKPPT